MDDSETKEMVRLGAQGDERALDDLFSRHRDRLRRMLRVRLDPRVRVRIDVSDVIQEVYLEASRRLPKYNDSPTVPFFVWLRSIVGQKLVDLHRFHLGAKARDARREVRFRRWPMPAATSAVLAAELLGVLSTPSEKAMQGELENRLREALESMDAKLREVLVLRHFEGLSNGEVAHELEVPVSTASQRYIQALKKLRSVLADMPGGLEAL